MLSSMLLSSQYPSTSLRHRQPKFQESEPHDPATLAQVSWVVLTEERASS